MNIAHIYSLNTPPPPPHQLYSNFTRKFFLLYYSSRSILLLTCVLLDLNILPITVKQQTLWIDTKYYKLRRN
jgi:hypothetical protein